VDRARFAVDSVPHGDAGLPEVFLENHLDLPDVEVVAIKRASQKSCAPHL
jgi:hypothetical protein